MEDIKDIEITGLSVEDCRKLYRHYSKDKTAKDETINEIIALTKRHTLAIELLAKTQLNGGLTADELLAQLVEKGFQLPDTEEVITYGHKDGEENNPVTEDRFIEHMSKIFTIANVKGENLRVLNLFSLLAPDMIPLATVKEWMDLPNLNVINDLHRRGWLLKEANKVSMHPVIAAVIQRQSPVENEEIKRLAMHLGNVLYINNAAVFTEKLPFLPHALSVTRFYQCDDEEAAGLINNIARIYRNQGDYSKALERNQRALAIFEKTLGYEHPDTAALYNNTAVVYTKQGHYQKAQECYQKAMAIYEKVLGYEHPYTATTYNNIALTYDQADYTITLEWLQKSLDIREKVLGSEHPDTANTYSNIALVYNEQGNYQKSLEWHQKALKIRENILGYEHPYTASTYNNMSLVYYNQEDYPKALEWLRKALAIFEKELTYEHPSTAITYSNIGWVYYEQADYIQALEWFSKALPILENRLGAGHRYTQSVKEAIAHITALLPTT
jgi:tetratricopeptide (TPR) repeat protein